MSSAARGGSAWASDVAQSRKAIGDALDGIARGTALAGNYSIDPVALSELKEILGAARRHSRRVLVFHPPLPAAVLAVRAAQFEHYRDTVNALLEPSDLLVDFNGPQYADMRADYGNFVDAVHLSHAGARPGAVRIGKALAAPRRALKRRSVFDDGHGAGSLHHIGFVVPSIADAVPQFSVGHADELGRPGFSRSGADRARDVSGASHAGGAVDRVD